MFPALESVAAGEGAALTSTNEVANVDDRLNRIRMLAMDVDGVLTIGEIIVSDNDDELRAFNAQDGLAVRLCELAGIKTAFISGRHAACVEKRAKDLHVAHFVLGTFDKVPPLKDIAEKEGLDLEEIAFVGDDVSDIPPMKCCGFAAAVANAVEEVKKHANYVTERQGGRGAVREVIELILKAQGKWTRAVAMLVGDESWDEIDED